VVAAAFDDKVGGSALSSRLRMDIFPSGTIAETDGVVFELIRGLLFSFFKALFFFLASEGDSGAAPLFGPVH
jgi:hypothetical protein